MGKTNEIKIGGLYQCCLQRLYVWDQPSDLLTNISSSVVAVIDCNQLFVVLNWAKIPDAKISVCCRVLTQSSVIGYVDVAPEDLKLATTT